MQDLTYRTANCSLPLFREWFSDGRFDTIPPIGIIYHFSLITGYSPRALCR
jgi:hypothetical protein